MDLGEHDPTVGSDLEEPMLPEVVAQKFFSRVDGGIKGNVHLVSEGLVGLEVSQNGVVLGVVSGIWPLSVMEVDVSLGEVVARLDPTGVSAVVDGCLL